MLAEDDVWDYRLLRRSVRPAGPKEGSPGRPAGARASPPGGGGGGRRGRGRGRARRPRSPPTAAPDPKAAPSPQLPGPEEGRTPAKRRPVHSGHCPLCQMPLSLLLVQTPRWHVAECAGLEAPGGTRQECPDGMLCDTTIPSHYKRYSHFLLAESRAMTQSAFESTFCNSPLKDIISPDPYHSQQSSKTSPSVYIKDSSASKNQNALLLLKSPSTKTVKEASSKKIAQSTRGNKSSPEKGLKQDVTRSQTSPLYAVLHSNSTQQLPGTVSQLATKEEFGSKMGRLFGDRRDNDTVLEVKSSDEDSVISLVPTADYDEDSISYSPLCSDDDIPGQIRFSLTRKRLFNTEAFNHDCKSDEDIFSDFKKLNESKEEPDFKYAGFDLTHVKKVDDSSSGCNSDSSDQFTDSANIQTKRRNKNLKRIKTQVKAVFSAQAHIPVDGGILKQEGNEFEPHLSETDLIKPAHSNLDCSLPLKKNADRSLKTMQLKQETGESIQSAPRLPLERRDQTDKAKVDNYSLLAGTSLRVNKQPLGLSSSVAVKEANACSVTGIASHSGGLQKDRTQALEMASQNVLARNIIRIPQKTVACKGLKQMDIGVFFGLEPKAKAEQELAKSTTETAAKELSSEISFNEKRPRQRKRKAGDSVGNGEETLGLVGSIPPKELGTRESRRSKRWKGEVSTPGKNESETEKNENGTKKHENGTTKKPCPFYKKIPGTYFTVDAFCYGVIEGCTSYFLTHFHSDHYRGLTKKFKCPIYCSKITGNLVRCKLRVEDEYIKTIPMNTECIVDGVKVVLLEANHCPGAVMLLFQLASGKLLLHTGDFRAQTSMERYPHLLGQKVHTLYLDTTYCSPEYDFPSQQQTIQFAASVAFEAVTLNPRTLIVCGTYSIGKEKIFLAIADVLGFKVCVSRDKLAILQCLESEQVNSAITVDWESSQFHLLPMMQINFKISWPACSFSPQHPDCVEIKNSSKNLKPGTTLLSLFHLFNFFFCFVYILCIVIASRKKEQWR
ncbi:DNA cross-link repair 1A protein isoform X2 [Callorhinchus milii]|uniref:DNA cross-link repair 1A protein isoform X2 n=1 Tax=Callorhinchus milii TaxID=7868 RepID=UPI001C3F7228|nr:DNA cross-link repair 1A protein isoform X2 [Callorhinchus milii]